jgi:hypothetical protein
MSCGFRGLSVVKIIKPTRRWVTAYYIKAWSEYGFACARCLKNAFFGSATLSSSLFAAIAALYSAFDCLYLLVLPIWNSYVDLIDDLLMEFT